MVKAADLVKNQKIKKKDKEIVFKKIYERIECKIQKASLQDLYECYYEIPEFILNLPLYNMNDCIQYLIIHMKSDGFNTKLIGTNTLWISWAV